MDWPKQLRHWWTEHGILPDQILDRTPIARLWLVWGLSESRRPHDLEEIKRRWNAKYRLAKGLPPV